MPGAREIAHILKITTFKVPFFVDRIKPHFDKVETTLAVYAHFSLLLKVFGEHRFGAF